MRLKKSKIAAILISLLLILTMVAGCSQPAEPAAKQEPPAKQEPAPSQNQAPAEPQAPSAEANLLDWAAWQAKMTGTINKDYYVVDLRTPDEIKLEKGLEGSINIDANETLAKGNDAVIEEKLANIPKDALILIHCKSGGRVKANLAKFLDKGYTNAYGLVGWTAFDSKGYMGCANISANTEQLKPEAWQAKMQGTAGQDYYIVDVRDQSEFEAGHMQGALNFGVRDQFTVDHAATMEKFAQAIPDKDALILIHCAVGKRAKVAHAHLKAEGYTNIFVLDNAVQIDKDGNVKYE